MPIRSRSLSTSHDILRLAALALSTIVAATACEPSQPEPNDSPDDDPSPSAEGTGGSGTGFEAPGASEPCNGLDDDHDGGIDEGCSCAEGATQACFPGSATQLNVGVCLAGTQTCVVEGGGELTAAVWSECAGAVGPSAETCGDGVDSDCDGSDAPCGEGGGSGTGGASGTGGGTSGSGGGGGGCLPTAEICDNGVDEDCDGVDEGCIVDVSIFLVGDCITASCPSTHPYPVGCDVFFSPGDDRGCVASTPSNSVVYFQAGDQCSAGLVTGTLSCSTQMGSPLSSSSCPINKPIPIYATAPSGCPEIQD